MYLTKMSIFVDNMSLLTQGSLTLAPVIFFSGQRKGLPQSKLLRVLYCCKYQKDKLLNWAQECFHGTTSHYFHLDLSYLTVITVCGF